MAPCVSAHAVTTSASRKRGVEASARAGQITSVHTARSTPRTPRRRAAASTPWRAAGAIGGSPSQPWDAAP
eukprot:scaffold37720_cov67-Phaeocystis_antarctica.AAC.4